MPSDDDSAGGAFRFRFNALPGDGNSDNSVSVTDLSNISSRVAQVAGDANYLATFDINADGAISVTDLVNTSTRIPSVLPAGEPSIPVTITAAPVVSAATAPQLLDALLSTEVVATVPPTPVEQVSLTGVTRLEQAQPFAAKALSADLGISATYEELEVGYVTAKFVDTTAAERAELSAAISEFELNRNPIDSHYRPTTSQRVRYRSSVDRAPAQLESNIDSLLQKNKDGATRTPVSQRAAYGKVDAVDELFANEDSLDILFDSIDSQQRRFSKRLR